MAKSREEKKERRSREGSGQREDYQNTQNYTCNQNFFLQNPAVGLPAGPVAKNPPAHARGQCSPGPGRFLHAAGQLSLRTTTTEPMHPRAWVWLHWTGEVTAMRLLSTVRKKTSHFLHLEKAQAATKAQNSQNNLKMSKYKIYSIRYLNFNRKCKITFMSQ